MDCAIAPPASNGHGQAIDQQYILRCIWVGFNSDRVRFRNLRFRSRENRRLHCRDSKDQVYGQIQHVHQTGDLEWVCIDIHFDASDFLEIFFVSRRPAHLYNPVRVVFCFRMGVLFVCSSGLYIRPISSS